MINLDVLLSETVEAIDAGCPFAKDAYISKWIPEITNEIQALREQVLFLNLQLAEAQSSEE